jgi:hypothetical protein
MLSNRSHGHGGDNWLAWVFWKDIYCSS